AGGLFVVAPLLIEFVAGELFALMGLALILLLAALPGLRRVQGGRDGRAGKWGLGLTFAGLAVMVVLVLSGDALDAMLDGTAQSIAEAAYLALGAGAALSALVGIVLFSVGMTRARILDPRGIWLFLGGMVLGLVSESFEQSLRGPVPWLADVLPPLGFIVAGVGLVVLGLSAREVEARSRTPIAAPAAT
ncbi:MAG TPA: hypothetical protein VFU85_10550, partial [Nocardioides sp.]|nr:hypothetical protein [Nocardioides sp.]